ncbi:MAG: hypothetical protein QM784_16210 [Polyangiaceae bacterium]
MSEAVEENGQHDEGSGVILAERRGGGLLPRELEPNMQTAGVLLVAVEGGALLPTWIGRCQDRVSDVFVLAGSSEEPADALLRRVEQRVSLLTGGTANRGLAVLVTEGGPVSTAAEIARLRVAQALLQYLSTLKGGTLLLLTDEDAPLESRVQLLSTAGNFGAATPRNEHLRERAFRNAHGHASSSGDLRFAEAAAIATCQPPSPAPERADASAILGPPASQVASGSAPSQAERSRLGQFPWLRPRS